MFHQFRKLVDPKNTSVYLTDLWEKFKSSDNEKELLTGLTTFWDSSLEVAAVVWTQYHNSTTGTREAHSRRPGGDLGMYPLQVNCGVDPY